MGKEEIRYKKDFLKTVILKVDFAAPIKEFIEELPMNLHKEISKHFPIEESKGFKSQTLKIKANKPEEYEYEEEELKRWNFFGQEREKKLTVTHEYLTISYMAYESFDKLGDEFEKIIKYFYEHQDFETKRLGLRYINSIEVNGKKPTSWEHYLNENLLSIFNVYDNKYIARALHNLELNFGDVKLRFQYGMHNPDYPSTIRKKQFILDYDAYKYDQFESESSIKKELIKLHDIILELFEDSIKDDLRRIMNEEE